MCANCRVEVFLDAFDEGRWYHGVAIASASGDLVFHAGDAPTGAFVYATATDSDGNTSEFGNPLQAIYMPAALRP